MKLLLVDDGNSGARDALDQLTETGGGFTYEWAPDIASAVQRLSEPDIDVILVGLTLPEGFGQEVFEKVHAFAAHIPIVVIASSSESEIAAQCISLGAQDSISLDEFQPALLTRVLRYACERHRLITALRDLSVVDEVTELYTLRGFTELGQHHLVTAQRMAQHVLLIYVEVQDAADGSVLEIATLLRSQFRGSDVVARVGPSEFAVLAMDADLASASTLIDRIMEVAHERALHGSLEDTAFSIGYTGIHEMPGASVADLLARARYQATSKSIRQAGSHQS
ncbi:MAG: GGDEF domain-containing protein [Longimicrobiales bacterium]